ncbi:MAG: GNAT family N-acetyltransferase [Pedobacter sp.]|nr:MAG: GNAT family N-acetyltransferase [Pedobacter sp.]
MVPEIKKYIPRYRNQVLVVWEKSVLATHHFLSEKDFIIIKANLSDFDFSTINMHCLVKDDEVLGFIAFNNHKIEMLFIDPLFIGKGFGNRLMNFALETFGANEVDVNIQNTRAVMFYERFGFKPFEETKVDDFGMNYPLYRLKLQ